MKKSKRINSLFVAVFSLVSLFTLINGTNKKDVVSASNDTIKLNSEEASTNTYNEIFKKMAASKTNNCTSNNIEYSLMYGDIDNEILPLSYVNDGLYTKDGTSSEQGVMLWDFQIRSGCESENAILKMKANEDMSISFNAKATSLWASAIYRMVFETNNSKKELYNEELVANGMVDFTKTYALKANDILYFVVDANDGVAWQTNNFEANITALGFDSSLYASQVATSSISLCDLVKAMIANKTNKSSALKDIEASFLYGDFDNKEVALNDYKVGDGILSASGTNDEQGNMIFDFQWRGGCGSENSVLKLKATKDIAISFDIKSQTTWADVIYRSVIETNNTRNEMNRVNVKVDNPLSSNVTYYLKANDIFYYVMDANDGIAWQTLEYSGNIKIASFDETKYNEQFGYTITWVIDNKTETTTVKKDEMPVHEVPTKASDNKFDYEFVKWEPEITKANQNATYTAIFKEVAKQINSISFEEMVRDYAKNNKEISELTELFVNFYYGNFSENIYNDFNIFEVDGLPFLCGLNQATNDQGNIVQTWQWRAGCQNENVFVKLTAKSDCKVNLKGIASTTWANALYKVVIESNSIQYEVNSYELNASVGSVDFTNSYYLKEGDFLFFIMSAPEGVAWQTCNIEGSVNVAKEFNEEEYEKLLGNPIENSDISYSKIVEEVNNNQGTYSRSTYDVSLLAGNVKGKMYEANIFSKLSDGLKYVAYCKDGQEKENHNDSYPVYFYPWMYKSGSASMAAIIKFTAKENIGLHVSTSPTTDKNEKGELFDWSSNANAKNEYYIQLVDGSIKKIYSKNIQAVSAKDDYAITVSLKKGESFYYTYVANWGIIVSNPIFTIDTESYDPNFTYTEIISNGEELNYFDMVTGFVNNDLNDVSLDNISYGFAYGKVNELKKFMYKGGDGEGNADDQICDIDASSDQEKKSNIFLRWQVRCSGTDDSIIYIKAKHNTLLSFTHKAITLDYASNMCVTVYVADENGIIIQLKSTIMNLVSEENEYLLDINLKENDTAYIVFSYPNGGIYTSTSNFEFNMKAIPSKYDESKRPDFATQIELNNIKKEKNQAMTDYVSNLNMDDYSSVKWIEIEDITITYKELIEKALTKEEALAIYDEFISKINSVENKTQEENNLKALKDEKKEYLNSLVNKKDYSSKDYKEISKLLEESLAKIDSAISKATINTIVAQFENRLQSFTKKKGCKGSVETTFVLVASLYTLIALKRKKD